MEDDPLLKSKEAAPPPPPPPPSSVTYQQPATILSGGKSWWRWGRGQAKRAYEEIIDDEEAFWTELWRAHNLALPSCYTLVGFIPAFAATPLSIYLVREINAHPTTQNQVAICTSLPWAFKILFGFCSDACPLALRRKPFMVVGTLLSTAAYLALAALGRPSAPELGLGLCCATFGLVMADTMGDALVVERSRTEPEGDHGHLQGALYAYRFGGAVAGAVAGALVYNERVGWGFGLTFAQVLAVAGLLPLLLLLPLLVPLREMPVARRGPHTRQSIVPEEVEAAGAGAGDATATVSDASASGGAAEVVELGGGLGLNEEVGFVPVSTQIWQIWEIIQLPIVYMPMAFVYCYNLFQIPNVAWTSFLVLSLDFTPYLLGSLTIASRVMTFCGVLLYKRLFLRSAWPLTYLWTTLLTAFFSGLQLLLIFQINVRFGISNFVFALGDEALASFVVGIQFLPLCVAYLKLCPRGSESTVYSMLTTFGNIALLAGNSLGTLFGRIWDVSNGALERGDLAGLWKLTVLTSCLSPLPLLLLPLLPADAAQRKAMRDGSRASPAAGVLFLVVLFVSLGWIIGQAVYVLSLNETG